MIVDYARSWIGPCDPVTQVWPFVCPELARPEYRHTKSWCQGWACLVWKRTLPKCASWMFVHGKGFAGVYAVRTVAQGRKYVTPEIAHMLVESLTAPQGEIGHEKLSDRELQTLVMIASGKRLSDIAEELTLSPKTVSVYRARVLEKLGFVREGTLREDCIVDGEVSDSWVYGLLRREWQPPP